MSLVLAIESSTSRASLALVSDSLVLFEGGFESDRNHNSLLFEPLQQAVQVLEGRKLSAVVIGTGPGSYSGTRVGIAAGQGVAMVHGCPAVGISSLLAAGISDGVAIGDARRGSLWWADVGTGKVPQPVLVPTQELPESLAGKRGIFTFEDAGKLGLPNEFEVEQRQPTAVRLVEAWQGFSEGLRGELEAAPPQPAYLRPPHITKARGGHPLLRSGKPAKG